MWLIFRCILCSGKYGNVISILTSQCCIEFSRAWVQLTRTESHILQYHVMHYYVFYWFTGLPKAAVITHLQSLKAAAGFWAFGVTKDDVMYVPLPLYHSAASLIGIGGTIELGRSLTSHTEYNGGGGSNIHNINLFFVNLFYASVPAGSSPWGSSATARSCWNLVLRPFYIWDAEILKD